VAYQFHPLFREFLLARGGKMFTSKQAIELNRRAAKLLTEEGEIEEAYKLHVQVQDWRSASRLMVEQAGNLLGEGRWRTVLEWLESLPQDVVDASADLLYWQGLASVHVDASWSRQLFKRSREIYFRDGNIDGQLLSLAGILSTLLIEDQTQSVMLEWVEPMQSLITVRTQWPSPSMELAVRSTHLLAISHLMLDHPLLESHVRRIIDLVDDEGISVNDRIQAAIPVLILFFNTSDPETSSRLIQKLDRLIERPEASALNQCMVLAFRGHYAHLVCVDHESAMLFLKKAESIAKENGLRSIAGMVNAFQGFTCALYGNDLAEAEAALARNAALGLDDASLRRVH
jgi:LuxR family transcriptional regulator, maltose regulon positive regulatory protein